MISPSELRVGNWVMCHDPKRREDPKDYPLQITWRHLKELSLDENISDYSPIEITQELLTKSNLQTTDNSEVFYRPNSEQFLKVQKLDGQYIMTTEQEKQVGVPIKYLHQLQNRYYSLFGEELEVAINK